MVLGSLLLAPSIWAEDYSMTDVQFFYGTGFHDRFADTDTQSGAMTTIGLEHYGTWRYGDNYFLVNFYQGDFIDATGQAFGSAARIFGKWISRLGIGALCGEPKRFQSLGFREVFAGIRIDRTGSGFYANMAGPGIDFVLPKGMSAGINLYFRKDRFNSLTYQISPFWNLPFMVRSIGLLFTGYLDLAGTDSAGADLFFQPQLLLDVGSIAFNSQRAIQLGLALAVHRNDFVNTTAPEVELRWTW